MCKSKGKDNEETIIIRKGEKKVIKKQITLTKPTSIRLNIINNGGDIEIRNQYYIKNSGKNSVDIYSLSLSNAIPITSIEAQLIIEKEAENSETSLNIINYKINKNAKTTITPGIIIKTKKVRGSEHKAKIKTISGQEKLYYNTRKMSIQDIEELMLKELTAWDFLIDSINE